MTVALMPELGSAALPYITNREHEPVIMDITPNIASEWLDRVPDTQRTVRDDSVDRYKKDMLAGNWRTDFSPFHFSKTGKLINGQHRCWAVVEANVILPRQAVVFGMDDDDYETLDQGAKRTFADTLKYYGYPNSVLLSALTYRLYHWQKTETYRKSNDRPAQYELLRLVRAYNDEMQPALRIGHKVSGHVKPIINSAASLAYLLFNRIDGEDAKEFFDRLIDGQGLLKGDPIYALRNRWAPNMASKREKPDDVVQGAIMIKAWNLYRAKKSVEILAWKPGGKNPEPFPQPK